MFYQRLLAAPLLLSSVAIWESQQLAENAEEVAADWVLYRKIALDDNDLTCANRSAWDWHVEVSSKTGEIAVKKWTPQTIRLPFEIPVGAVSDQLGAHGPQVVLRVDEGWLAGFDRGEWGGALVWFSESGDRWVRVMDERIVHLSYLDGAVLVVSVNANRSSHVYRATNEPAWSVMLIASVDGEAYAATIEHAQSLIVVTNTVVARIDAEGHIEPLVRVSLGLLFPNSLVIRSNKEIYIGLRHFILRLAFRESRYVAEWLVPKECQTFHLPPSGWPCTCNERSEGFP